MKKGEFRNQQPLVDRLLEEGFNSTDIASALLHELQSSDAGGGAVNVLLLPHHLPASAKADLKVGPGAPTDGNALSLVAKDLSGPSTNGAKTH